MDVGEAASNNANSDTPDEGATGGGNSANFDCNICLDTAQDAVVSMCGHLFCWPCLHRWLETQQIRAVCPVCKAGISKDKVVPLYGRGNAQQTDPRDRVPPRPQGQRTEPEAQGQGFGGGLFGADPAGFHMSFGIGAFPFGLFATTFNMGNNGWIGNQTAQGGDSNPNSEEEAFLGKVFLYIAILFVFWLIIA